MEQEQHQGSHRREHSQEKYEGDSPVIYEKGRQRPRRIHISGTNESQRHGGVILTTYTAKVSQSATCTTKQRGSSDPRTCPAGSSTRTNLPASSTVDDENFSGSGRKLIGMQAGILLEIGKETTATNLSCHVFVVADGIINNTLQGNKLQGVEY